ncbi:MAG: choice-of-anchor tandem repeat GloVer-containing protein [Candidatus Sulfotelmatobacter sp.]
MTYPKIVLSKIAHFHPLKSFRTSAVLILATLMLVVAAATMTAAQTFTDLYNFDNGPNDPHWNTTVQGRDGNMYSTTPQVWSGQTGDIFKITPAGIVTNLFTFDGTDGGYLQAGLTLALDGNFYGAASNGGSHGFGTVFKVTPGGAVTTLYNFTNGADGAYPSAPPIQGLDGNFYGNASSCAGFPGTSCIPFDTYGSIYKITPEGTFKVLHTFSGPDGINPFGQLVQGSDGDLYGTTLDGGANGLGTVFKITTTGVFTLLYTFDGTHGAHPLAGGLIQGYDGNFYGVATEGGSSGAGLLFKITPNGRLTVVYDFADSGCCSLPNGGVVQATDGNFYGTTVFGGNVFRVTPSGEFTDLANIGGSPQSLMLQHTNGILYSDNAIGGSADRGYFFSMNVGLAPFVSFQPAARAVGGVVEILGQGFTGAASVSFNGAAAAFTVESDTYLTATVPAGATTGSIIVTEPSGTLKSNKIFRVRPQIFSFSPTSGPVGTAVTITGSSLTQTTKVDFCRRAATSFTVHSDTQVTATVPAGTTTTVQLVITTAGGEAPSPGTFTVTP